MKVCEYYNCNRTARYFMGWNNLNGSKHFGLVCATHDRELGRNNLVNTGMSTAESILFERYLKETVNLVEYPDWPEWLKRHAIAHGRTRDVIDLEALNISPRTFNALYRHRIRTADELATLGTDELMKIRQLDERGIAEIQQALRELHQEGEGEEFK